MNTGGIHHVTTVASEPQQNLNFCVQFLGLRLVKQTVNFDDPGTWHLYYGDEVGRPGTLLTSFPVLRSRRGSTGNGQAESLTMGVPTGALEFWEERAQRYGATAERLPERFGAAVLRVSDSDGLALDFAEAAAPEGVVRPDGPDIPAEWEIHSVHGVTLQIADEKPTADLLTGLMGFREAGRNADRVRFASGSGSGYVDLLVTPAAGRGRGGAGAIHHVAFRVPDEAAQKEIRDALLREGLMVTPIIDRSYFRSVYFREPGGVLFEIATDGPGFATDESPEELGNRLCLPQQYEPMRGQIEAALPPITIPTSTLLSESY